jgi:predicted ester cyclase
MSLFRRKAKEGEVPLIVQLYRDEARRPALKNEEIVKSHLEELHRPGGVAAEKKKHDFIDHGMSREYLEALDDIAFTLEEQVSSGDQVASRWTVRGVNRRPLLGVEPSGEEVVIEGITISVVRDERVRGEWALWDFPPYREQLAGAARQSV